jgi:hypothetical protein
MSQNDNFSSGFFWGALLGGIAGGVVGALLVNPWADSDESEVAIGSGDGRGSAESEASPGKSRRRSLRLTPEADPPIPARNMESARQSLEDKIASLNDAIDDVRQQLHQVNATGQRTGISGPEGGDDRSVIPNPSEETS